MFRPVLRGVILVGPFGFLVVAGRPEEGRDSVAAPVRRVAIAVAPIWVRVVLVLRKIAPNGFVLWPLVVSAVMRVRLVVGRVRSVRKHDGNPEKVGPNRRPDSLCPSP